MDEHDLLPQLVLILLHHLAELGELVIEHVGIAESRQVVDQLGDVQVLHNGLHLFLLHRLGLAARALVAAALVAHGVLEGAAVEAQRLCWQVVAGDLQLQHWRVEVFALMEAVQLVELCHVEAQLHQRGVLQGKPLSLLEGDVLHCHVGHRVQVVVAKLVERHLRVGLHQVVVACGPLAVLVAACHVGEVEEVVAVVHQHRVERGGVQVLDLAGLVGEHDVEHLALLGLKHRLHGFGLWLGRRHVGLHEFALYLQRLLIGGVVRLGGVDHHHFACQSRALEAVLVFHIHHLAVDSRHTAASHIVEKAHYIIHFYHVISFLLLLLTAKVVIFPHKSTLGGG